MNKKNVDNSLVSICVGTQIKMLSLPLNDLPSKIPSPALGNGFTLAGVITGGVPTAVNIIRDLYHNSEISYKDVVTLVIAIIAAVGLVVGYLELLNLILSIGGSIWDIFAIASH